MLAESRLQSQSLNSITGPHRQASGRNDSQSEFKTFMVIKGSRENIWYYTSVVLGLVLLESGTETEKMHYILSVLPPFGLLTGSLRSVSSLAGSHWYLSDDSGEGSSSLLSSSWSSDCRLPS